MDIKFFVKVMVFILGFELIIYWYLYWDMKLSLIWFLNLIVLIILFGYFNIESIKNTYKKISSFVWVESAKLDNDDLSEIWDIVKYYNRHYILVLSWTIVVISLFDHFLKLNYWINVIASVVFFLISLIIGVKDVQSNNIYIWKRNINMRNMVYILSIIVALIFLPLLKDFSTYNKLFLVVLIGFIFYSFWVLLFGLVLRPSNLFRHISFNLYWMVLLVTLGLYIWNDYTDISDIFKKKQIVYQEKIVYVPQVQESSSSSMTQDQANEIIVKLSWTWVALSWDENLDISNIDSSKIQDAETKQLIDSLKVLLKEDSSQSSISSNVLSWVSNSVLSYRDVIPYVMQKYNISSESKKDVVFKYIKTDDPNYWYFKSAYYLSMFWLNSNPDWKILCQNLAVLVGMALWWEVDYNKANIFEKYWEKALIENSNFKNCSAKQPLTYQILQSIIK